MTAEIIGFVSKSVRWLKKELSDENYLKWNILWIAAENNGINNILILTASC